MIDAGAIERLREIIRLHAEGDFDAMSEKIDEAGTWLGELDLKPDPSSGETEDPAPAERTLGASVTMAGLDDPDPGKITVKPGRLDVSGEHAALVSLWNAASRLLAQGPSASSTAELEAAVRAAEPHVR